MEWAIRHILKSYAENRSIVVLGQGYNALKWMSAIEEAATVSRSIRTLNDPIDSASEYLIICEDACHDYSARFAELGLTELRDYYNWTKHAQTNGHLPIDVEYNGITIGYGSYFPYSKKSMKHIKKIGRFCSIANSALIQGNHSMNRIMTSSLYPLLYGASKKVVETSPSDKDPRKTNRTVEIGNDVWIGANAFINASKCAKIGDGAVIGAGSLVMGDVPPYAIVYGTPAKVQGYRFSPDEIALLMQIEWWNWDQQTLNEHIDLLVNPDLFFEKFLRR